MARAGRNGLLEDKESRTNAYLLVQLMVNTFPSTYTYLSACIYTGVAEFVDTRILIDTSKNFLEKKNSFIVGCVFVVYPLACDSFFSWIRIVTSHFN